MITGYRFHIGKKMSLKSNILAKKIFNSLSNNYYDAIDANLQLQHAKWKVGLSYVTQKIIGINAGVCIEKRLYLRTSYDYITSRLNQYQEISNISFMLAYRSVK